MLKTGHIDLIDCFMKLIHPRLLDLARTYGLVTLENEGITVWKHGDDVYRIPKERPKLSPKQIEAKKAARREASRAIRDKMQSPSGKKGS